jgi:hypothetical protein
MTKWVYRFGDGTAEGRAEMKDLLGGKGAGLAEMSNLGLPVPPGFTSLVMDADADGELKRPGWVSAGPLEARPSLHPRRFSPARHLGLGFGGQRDPHQV